MVWLFTNHHCGYDAIQQHSSVEHDYLRDGFVADSLSKELPNPDLFVSFPDTHRGCDGACVASYSSRNKGK